MNQTRQQRDPDDHRDGVVVQEPVWTVREDAGEPADQAGAAVDREAVDQCLVAALPESGADQPGAAGEETAR